MTAVALAVVRGAAFGADGADGGGEGTQPCDGVRALGGTGCEAGIRCTGSAMVVGVAGAAVSRTVRRPGVSRSAGRFVPGFTALGFTALGLTATGLTAAVGPTPVIPLAGGRPGVTAAARLTGSPGVGRGAGPDAVTRRATESEIIGWLPVAGEDEVPEIAERRTPGVNVSVSTP